MTSKIRRAASSGLLLSVLAMVLVLALAAYFATFQGRISRAEEYVDTLQDQLLAHDIQPVEGPQGERGPGPTRDEIAEQVELFFARNPTELDQVVAVYMAANPPVPGPPGAPGMTAPCVTAPVDPCVGPEGPQGDRGDRGEDGRTPSNDEIAESIAAAVAEYLLANPPPAGPKGDAGPICEEHLVRVGRVIDGETWYVCVDPATISTTTTTTLPTTTTAATVPVT